MQLSFSQLVWLGAHTATEPTDLLQYAKQATLFEARETACLMLRQKFPQKNVTVIQTILTTTNTIAGFTEYNLAEFSAIQPATGLKNLFPGLKAINKIQLTSTAINDAINSLELNDNNNLLIVDIADSSLALLNAIEAAKQLHFFSAIYVQTANEPLYEGAATAADITAFLQTQGYVLQQTTGNDPDLPWLSFSLNPLWNTLQQAQENNNSLSAELIQTKLQLSAAQQEVATSRLHVEQAKSEHMQQLESVHIQLSASKQELQKQEANVNELNIALAAVKKTKQDIEQQLTASKQQLATAQQEIATFKQNTEQAKSESAKLRQILEQQIAEQNQKLAATQKELANSEQKLIAIELEAEKRLLSEKEKLKQPKEAEKKYGGDDQIEDFLSDIAPFFYGKFITYVDIGAYTGQVLEKIISSKKLSIREAHLYEPNPASFEKLKTATEETKINSLHLNNFALGETEKKSNFIAANAMTKISGDSKEDETTGVFSSEIKTLDSQLDRITEKHIHLLKIDVEGYEMEVLAGAIGALKLSNIDVIYIEVGFNKNGTQQTYMGKIDSFLQDAGYRVFRIYEQRNEWIEDSPLLRRCNFSYMSESFSKANPYKLTKTIAELKAEIKTLQQPKKN